MENDKTQSAFLFIGNALWLDLVNTQLMSEGKPVDLLSTGEALIAWAVEAGVLELGDLPQPGEWDRLLAHVVRLRGVLRGLAEQMDIGQELPDDGILAVNEALWLQHPVLTRREKRWHSDLCPEGTWESRLLAPIAQSFAAVLVRGDEHLVHKCEAADCVLFFYDTSKNHKRRWCSMAQCGNRSKAAALYRRRKPKVKKQESGIPASFP